jgi:hypothetical protein
MERQQREWEEMNAVMPQFKHVPSSTSKFALKVYSQVFDALASYNIRFKAEFSYLDHHLYEKASGTAERGLRVDLLVEIDLEGRKKPLTVVIEAQG